MKHTPPPLDLPASAVLSIRKTEKLSDGVTAMSGTEGVSHVSVKQMMLQSLMSRWKLILALRSSCNFLCALVISLFHTSGFCVSGVRQRRVKLLTVMAESKNKCCCSVPQCTNSKQKQPYLSFQGFPLNEDQKRKWVITIRREEGSTFVIRRSSTYVCSQHFTAADYVPGSSRPLPLKVGAIPSRFLWNNFHVPPQRLSAFERTAVRLGVDVRVQEQPAVLEDVPNESIHVEEHDYMARPPAGMHLC